jgi:CDGSH-type Zn-finger protein
MSSLHNELCPTDLYFVIHGGWIKNCAIGYNFLSIFLRLFVTSRPWFDLTAMKNEVKPVEVVLEAGKTYLWCQCGLSKNQPFCDNSHVGTHFKPKVFSVLTARTVCSASARKPGIYRIAMARI